MKIVGVIPIAHVHSLLVLPYNDTTAPQVTLDSVDLTNSLLPIVHLTATTATNEIDLNQVTVILYDNSGGSLVEIDRHVFDIMEWTYKYSGTNSSSDITILDTTPDYDGIYDDAPTFGADSGVISAPAQFNGSSPQYALTLTFNQLTGLPNPNHLYIVARATDVRGNFSEDTYGSPAIATVPIVNEYGTIGLILILGLAAFFRLRRNQTTAAA